VLVERGVGTAGLVLADLADDEAELGLADVVQRERANHRAGIGERALVAADGAALVALTPRPLG
jgi:hypothetical protein